MITRRYISKVQEALSFQPAVMLLGPRQAGKTTLALQIADARPSIYLDLELPSDRKKLEDPVLFLTRHEDKLVILDEVHHVPELFQTLRGLIDQGRRKGNRAGRFLMLGSAAFELLKQSETLAGRMAYVDMAPLDALEVSGEKDAIQKLWLRGGYPDSYLIDRDDHSFSLRHNLIRAYLERDIPTFGPRIAAETLERLWTMLAHSQGTLLNASKLAGNLSLSAPSVRNYIGLFNDLMLVRILLPFHQNTGKRMTKSPKLYVRDSGLLHTLLDIRDLDALAGHPIVGMSWEGFVIENLLAVAPENTQASFYRTAAGAEMDLVLDMGSKGRWAIEIKHGLTPNHTRGFYHAVEDLQPTKTFIVYSGEDRYSHKGNAEVIGLKELMGGLVEG